MRQLVNQDRGEEQGGDDHAEDKVIPERKSGLDFGHHPESRNHPDVQHGDRGPTVINDQRDAEDASELKILELHIESPLLDGRANKTFDSLRQLAGMIVEEMARASDPFEAQ